MPIAIVVEKNGNLKEVNIKDNININELYKKCNFRKPDGFDHIGTWDDNKIDNINYNIELYARRSGKANTENKYDFPPPEDNTLFFGDCLLLGKDSDDNIIELKEDVWLKIYENLFGGFEDLDATAKEDADESDELEGIPDKMKTKTGGYLKDGFVVDDEDIEGSVIDSSSETEDEDSEDEDSELEEELYDYSD